jgi:hypothetical protein
MIFPQRVGFYTLCSSCLRNRVVVSVDSGVSVACYVGSLQGTTSRHTAFLLTCLYNIHFYPTHFKLEDGSSMFLRKTGVHPQDITV